MYIRDYKQFGPILGHISPKLNSNKGIRCAFKGHLVFYIEPSFMLLSLKVRVLELNGFQILVICIWSMKVNEKLYKLPDTLLTRWVPSLTYQPFLYGIFIIQIKYIKMM